MNVSRIRLGTLALLTVGLLGCASTPPTKEATPISGPLAKDAAKGKAPAANSAPGDIDNALRQARAARAAGDLEGAAKTLSQLVLMAPDDPMVLGEYAKTLIARGRSGDALAFLERAIELRPADWSLFSALGVAYDQKGDYQAAQASYGRALALKPGEPTVLSNSALSHMQSGDLEGAEKLLMQAAQSGAEFPRIAGNLALMRSLKNSNPQPAAAKAPASAPVAAAPAAVPPNGAAETAPLPAPKALQQSGEPASLTSSVQDQPAALPKILPAAPVTSPMQADGASSSSLQRLKTDPSVRMQAVPADAEGGPVAPTPLAVKKAASPAEPGQAAAAPVLRRALSLPPPARQRDTQQ
jgi:Flp pilus assembly protein TadD